MVGLVGQVAGGLVGVDPSSRVETITGGTPPDARSDVSGVAFEHGHGLVGDPGLGGRVGFAEDGGDDLGGVIHH